MNSHQRGIEDIFKLYYDILDQIRSETLAQEYKLRKQMSNFEHLTRKVVGNMQKYSMIEFYHEQHELEQRLKELGNNLE